MSARSYGQHCGVARALDVVGGRWTLLILRNLLLGPLRFTELQRSLPGIAPNLLADRLRDLEVEGLVESIRTPPPTAVDAYALTERGRALEPAILELGRWGWPYMAGGPRGDRTDPAWGLLALKRSFVPRDDRAVVQLVLDGAPFHVVIDGTDLEIARGPAPGADAVVEAAWPAMADVLHGGRSLRDAERDGALAVSGRRRRLRAFLSAFGLRR